MERVRLPFPRLPRAHWSSPQPDDDPDFDADDSEIDPTDEFWDPSDLEEDDEEPEPEYGDFWQEPDDFED